MTASRSWNELNCTFDISNRRLSITIYNNFQYSNREDKNHIAVTVTKFDDYFVPTKKCDLWASCFFLREQEIDENIDSFVTNLRDLACSFEFYELTDNLIKDKLIWGIRNRPLKYKLLKVKDFTLSTALEISKLVETTSKQLEGISSKFSNADMRRPTVSNNSNSFKKTNSSRSVAMTSRPRSRSRPGSADHHSNFNPS